MRFGYWMPIFGGWLRNVPDEGMSIDWPYIRDVAVESEQHGFELSLIAELNLNDIKGHRAPSLDCWALAPAVLAVTSSLELMLAVRPNYHSPSLTAKALPTLDVIAPGGSRSTWCPRGGRTRRRSTACLSTSTTPATPGPRSGSKSWPGCCAGPREATQGRSTRRRGA